MTTSLVDAQSVLAIDIGSAHTRALLFDEVDGQYALIAAGSAPSTTVAPYLDASEGMLNAIQHLTEVTGRAFLDNEGRLLLPARPDGSGVDRLAITLSAGPELRLVTTGLLADVSLESAQRLAATVTGQVVESIGLNDRRRLEAQLDALIKARPDLVIITGGTDQGATRSVLKTVDLLQNALRLLPQGRRPLVLYAGNAALEKRVRDALDKLTTVSAAPNVRPGIDGDPDAQLQPAAEELARTVTRARLRQVGGLDHYEPLVAAPILPTAHAFGRAVRILAAVTGSPRGVFGVDLGARTTALAAAAGGRLALQVFSPFGMGEGAPQALQQGRLEDVTRWLPLHVPDETVRDAIWQKSLFPASLPLTGEALAIEQALARQLLRIAAGQFRGWPGSYDTIVASGAALTGAPTPGQALLVLLDALQPAGVANFYLDLNNLLPALGAAAAFNSLLPVQVLENGGLLHLGAVISPAGSARYGTPILRAALEGAAPVEIKQGTLTVLPLAAGQSAQLALTPLRSLGERIPRGLAVTGGACGGVVIDARGRPLDLPADAARRREMIKKWMLALT